VHKADETGVLTAQAPTKIIPETGNELVGRVTRSERGTLVTVRATV
jgi:hypothetical protein